MSFLDTLLHRTQAFALDLSDSTLQMLEIQSGKAGATSSIRLEIPPGLIQEGEIKDQAALAEVIRTAYSQSQPAPPVTRRVIAELPESRTLSIHLTIPHEVQQKQLMDAVVEQAEARLPVNLDDYGWDYQVLGTTGRGDYEVLFAAAPAKLIQEYEQTISLAGLELCVLELESLALSRAILQPKDIPIDSAVVILDIGGRSSSLLVVDQAGLQLSVTIFVAGDALTQAISKKLKLKDDTAEKRKRRSGFKDAELASPMRKALTPLFDEYRRLVEYYQKKMQKQVARVLLVGGSSALIGLREELASNFGVPCESASLSCQLHGIESQQIAVACGLAMRASRLSSGINFIVPS